MFFFCFPTKYYPKNHYFLRSFTGLTLQEFDNIYKKEIGRKDIVNMRSSVYAIKKKKKKRYSAGRHIKPNKDRIVMLLVIIVYIHENLVVCWYSFISCLAIFKYIFHSNKVFQTSATARNMYRQRYLG